MLGALERGPILAGTQGGIKKAVRKKFLPPENRRDGFGKYRCELKMCGFDVIVRAMVRPHLWA